MSRQEKGSRMRMLPARLQLQQRDAHTGSYPIVSRFSTDGRSGIYNTSFNDTKTVVFTSSNDYMPIAGFPKGSNWLNIDGSSEDAPGKDGYYVSKEFITTFELEDYVTIKIHDGKENWNYPDTAITPANFSLYLLSTNGVDYNYVDVYRVETYIDAGIKYMYFYLNEPGMGLNYYPPGSKCYLATKTTVTTGSVRSQVIDGLPFVHFTPGQELTPFRDNAQPAADGKSSNNPFFTTGSAELLVGEGFSSPLWSKNKIEIDISVPVECGADLYISGSDFYGVTPPASALGVSHEMLYYNFNSKTWEGIGQGWPYGSINTHSGLDFTVSNYGNMIGFAPGIVNLYADPASAIRKTEVSGVFETQASAGEPTTSCGFPYHPKYHATSSQICNMAQYINAPFLVEKIVVELSAAYTIPTGSATYWTGSYSDTHSGFITSITQSTVPAAINNFFILNQRRPNKLNTVPLADSLTGSLPASYILSKSGPYTYIDTLRDIVTWGGISSFASNMFLNSTRQGLASYAAVSLPLQTMNPKELMMRDFNFSSSLEAHRDLSPLSWQGKIKLDLPAKSPVAVDKTPASISDNCFSYISIRDGAYGFVYKPILKFSNGGRNGLGIFVPNARNYISPVITAEQHGGFTINGSATSDTMSIILSANHYRYNPYILFPEDNLVFGWQQPLMNVIIAKASSIGIGNANVGTFSSIRFLPGEAKVTLYGSYISNDKEYNDGTNQLLSSDSVHEVIGEG